ALVRVAAMGEYRRYASNGMDQVAHMLFAHGAHSLFATHPPLIERLQALDASINPDRLESLKRQAIKAWQSEPARDATPASSQPAGAHEQMPLHTGVAGPVPAAMAVPAAAALIAATAGDPAPRHLDQAVAVRRALPAALRASAEDPDAAQAILLSIVVFSDHAVRDGRLKFIGGRMGADMAARVQRVAPVSTSLAPLLRLPAVLQLIPALRGLPAADRLLFIQTLRDLTRLDGGVTV